MTTKTYGVDGLIEWHMAVPAGRMKINVEFSGGKISGYGVSPATFSTSDPVLQRAIENSRQHRCGRIRIVRCEDTGGHSGARPSGAPAAPATPAPEERIVDVPDWNSARQQLMRLTGLPADRLRLRSQIEEAAKNHGITLKVDD